MNDGKTQKCMKFTKSEAFRGRVNTDRYLYDILSSGDPYTVRFIFSEHQLLITGFLGSF